MAETRWYKKGRRVIRLFEASGYDRNDEPCNSLTITIYKDGVYLEASSFDDVPFDSFCKMVIALGYTQLASNPFEKENEK